LNLGDIDSLPRSSRQSLRQVIGSQKHERPTDFRLQQQTHLSNAHQINPGHLVAHVVIPLVQSDVQGTAVFENFQAASPVPSPVLDKCVQLSDGLQDRVDLVQNEVRGIILVRLGIQKGPAVARADSPVLVSCC